MDAPAERRMFVPVAFNAEHGGLHNHVACQITAARRAGWAVTLLCPDGDFAATQRDAGVGVITTTFEDRDADIRRAIEEGPYDLVHAHPFASRAVGTGVARNLAIPVIVTYHGPYLDSLHLHHANIDLVMAVSGATSRFLSEHSPIAPSRVAVIPNGVDTTVFSPPSPGGSERARQVVVATRFDRDKTFIIEVLEEAWNAASRDPETWADVQWVIAGDGSDLDRVRRSAAVLAAAFGREVVDFRGWCGPADLAELFRRSTVAVAPGRAALEAIACGATTVALGSRGYAGLVDGDAAAVAVESNFGGGGARWDDYVPGSLLRDITDGLRPGPQERRAALGGAITRLFDQAAVDEQWVRYWDLIAALPPVRRARPVRAAS